MNLASHLEADIRDIRLDVLHELVIERVTAERAQATEVLTGAAPTSRRVSSPVSVHCDVLTAMIDFAHDGPPSVLESGLAAPRLATAPRTSIALQPSAGARMPRIASQTAQAAGRAVAR